MIKLGLHRGPERLLFLGLGIVLLSSLNAQHDWGGDFAQYLNNAKNLGFALDERIEVLESEHFAPKTRGPGFSMLLYPAYLVFGDSMLVFTALISLSLWLCGIVLFRFYDFSTQSGIVSGLLVLLFVFHGDVVAQKLEVLPTFPFMAVLYSIFIFTQVKGYSNVLAIGLLTGLLISIRNVGSIALLVILIHLLSDVIQKFDWAKCRKILIYAIVSIGVELLIKLLVFRTISYENITWYGDWFSGVELQDLLANAIYYYDQYLVFTNLRVAGHTAISQFFLVITAIGGFLKIRTCWELSDTFFIFYCVLIIVYPGQAGIRFLLPVVPIALNYFVTAFSRLDARMELTWPMFSAGVLILLFSLGLPKTLNSIKAGKSAIFGPQSDESKRAFDAIRSITKDSESIAFFKPWVLNHYTDRTSMPINPKTGQKDFSMAYLEMKMMEHGVEYILVCEDARHHAVYNPLLNESLKLSSKYLSIWNSESFRLYQFNGAN